MSDHGLKVGDVCKEFARLRVGMAVRVHAPDEICMPAENGGRFVIVSFNSENGQRRARDRESFEIDTDHVRDHGVTILALPEEAPKPAAPSLDAVPVGSRWRWKVAPVPRAEGPFTFRSEEELVRYDSGQYSDLPVNRAEILAHATRIDEPAGAGKQPFTAANIEKHANGSLTVTLQNGAKMFFRDLEAMNNGTATDPPRAPAYVHRATLMPGDPGYLTIPKPPAGCAPGCTPSRACRITIPVTDKGTRYECPAFREEADARSMHWRNVLLTPERQARDQAEARAMRDQRWEPAPNGLGAFPGRYRFDRRPR